MKIIKNHLLLVITILALILISGCNGSSTSTTDTTTNPRTTYPQLGGIEFADSYHYVANNVSGDWNKIEKVYLENGRIPANIKVPSELITTTAANAEKSIVNAVAQFNGTLAGTTDSFNKIPFFALKKQPDVIKYVFSYKRYTTTATGDIKTVLAQSNGEFDNIGDYAYLPLVQEKFGFKLVDLISQEDTLSYTHSVSVTAIASDKLPSPIKTFTFKLDLQVVVKGILTVPVAGINAIKLTADDEGPYRFDFLKDRWTHYYSKNSNGDINEGDPNRSFEVAKITNGQPLLTQPTATDIRFVFKSDPVLKMSQELFVEETIDLEAYKLNQTISTRRNVFKTRTIELNSSSHFRASFKVNGIAETVVGKVITHNNIPANTNWELTLAYDFKKSDSYSPALTLLNPLRSECDITRNRKFLPVTDSLKKASVKKALGFYATCHPDTNDSLTYNQSQKVNPVSILEDTWNEYFSYRPNKVLSSNGVRIEDAGNFYGIKSIKFYAEGCLKFYIKDRSDFTTFGEASNYSSAETVARCGGEAGWSYFKFDITDDIKYHTGTYQTGDDVTGHPHKENLIPAILNYLPNFMNMTRPDFMFNGTTNLESVF